MVTLVVSQVETVRAHPNADRLTIVKVQGIEHEVVANRHEDGSARWTVGEYVVYVPENTILPLDVVKERGYWDDVKNKGLLGGSKSNRVKMQRFAGFESRGLLFKVDFSYRGGLPSYYVKRDPDLSQTVVIGDDVTDFFGATEYQP